MSEPSGRAGPAVVALLILLVLPVGVLVSALSALLASYSGTPGWALAGVGLLALVILAVAVRRVQLSARRARTLR